MISKNCLDDASRIWKMLDDLAESNPHEYKNFISKQINTGLELMKPPKLKFSVIATLEVTNI